MSAARYLLVTIVLAVLCVGISSPRSAAAANAADEPSVAVLGVRVEGELEAHVRDQLQEQLAQGLTRGELTVASAEQVRSAFEGIDACDALACFAEAVRASGAVLGVRADLVVRGRDYELHVEVIDAKNGTVLHKRESSCEICGTAEVIEQLGNEASAVVPFIVEYTQARSVLEVRSEPPGARVLVDGSEVGTTPFSGEVIAGERVVAVSKAGFTSSERRVTVDRGATSVVDVQLDPVAPEPKPGPHAALGWTPIAVGAAAIGAGVALIVIEEDPVAGRCDDPNNLDAFGTCRYRYKTLEGGIAMAAAGAALVVTGAVILGIRAKRAKDRGGSERAQARWGTSTGGLWVRF